MKVAFSIWNQRIAPVFDVSQKLLCLEIEEGRIIGDKQEVILDQDSVKKVSKLAENMVQELVCGAISRPLAEMAHSSGINVIPFIAGDIEEVVRAYLEGGLPNPTMIMPGCCTRRERFRGGRRCGAGWNQNKVTSEERSFIEKRRRKMPRRDGTGPLGLGPGTGRGRGRCGGGQGGEVTGGRTGQGKRLGRGMSQSRKGGSGRGKNR